MRTELLTPPATSAPEDVLAGTRYRIVRPLGRGGMGEVYEAEHIELEKRVVVKFLRSELSNDASLAERLRIEAKAMARLDNPHIAAVYDLGTTPAGRPYFVMEYLRGRTVAQEVHARGPFSVREAIRILLAVLDGLAAAHAAGLVHRDIKPPNVFLCDPDSRGHRAVKILDFGVVKVSPGRIPRSFPTEQGQFIGSPAAAAPEQVRGQELDGRADIYTAGLLLYYLIAGKSPFAAANIPHSALWAHILSVPAPLSTAASQPVPIVLDMIVATALAKDPAERYAGAAQMAAALERVAAKLPPDEVPSRRPAPRDLPAPAAVTGERASQGTLVQRRPAPQEPTAELPTPAAAGVRPARPPILARARAVLSRIPAAALIAAISGVLFFGVLQLLWSILRSVP